MQELEIEYSLAELESALGSLKTGKAGGADGVSLDALKHLGKITPTGAAHLQLFLDQRLVPPSLENRHHHTLLSP